MKSLTKNQYSIAVDRFNKWDRAGYPGADKGLPELLNDLFQIQRLVPLWSCIGHPNKPGSQPYITFGIYADSPDRYIDEILEEIFISGILNLEYGLMVAPWHEDVDFIMAEDMVEFTIPTFTIRGPVMGTDIEQNKMAKGLFISNIQSIAIKLEAFTNS